MATLPVVVPLLGVASQMMAIVLGNQACTINVYTKHIQVPAYPDPGIPTPPQQDGIIVTSPPVYAPIDPVFLDLYKNDVLVLGGVLARNNVLIVRNTYFGFVGDLSFADTEGTLDPQWQGLGTRWLLLYWPDLP